MFQYVVVLLTINLYSCSLGAPSVPNSLLNSLTELSSKCNLFLSDEIKVKIKECDVAVPPYGVKQLQCLMFYDMSQQMCSLFSSRPDFNVTNYLNYLKLDQDIFKLCDGTKDWKFRNITTYPEYKVKVEKIRKNITCYKLCWEDDTDSSNSNFFCKYYKWGSDMLRFFDTPKNPKTDVSKLGNTDQNTNGLIKATNLSEIPLTNEEHLSGAKLLSLTPIDDVGNASELKGKNIKETPTVKQLNVFHSVNNSLNTTSDLDKPSTTVTNVVDKVNNNINGNSSALEHTPVTNALEHTTDTKKQDLHPGSDDTIKQKAGTGENSIPQIPTGYSSSISPQGDKNQQLHLKVPILPGEPQGVMEVPKQKFQIDVGGDLEETDSGPFPDSDIDPDFEEPNIQEELPKGNTKLKIETPSLSLDNNDFQKDQNADKSSKTMPETIEAPSSSLNDETYQKEYAAQEQEDFAEEDDHFFPFFLTAVILVVLLYVFYHNKNRVLGLIVEGRQSNRRRNSRGHAYRRLDTLEQAMSGGKRDTPPSKIIY